MLVLHALELPRPDRGRLRPSPLAAAGCGSTECSTLSGGLSSFRVRPARNGRWTLTQPFDPRTSVDPQDVNHGVKRGRETCALATQNGHLLFPYVELSAMTLRELSKRGLDLGDPAGKVVSLIGGSLGRGRQQAHRAQRQRLVAFGLDGGGDHVAGHAPRPVNALGLELVLPYPSVNRLSAYAQGRRHFTERVPLRLIGPEPGSLAPRQCPAASSSIGAPMQIVCSSPSTSLHLFDTPHPTDR